MRSCLGVVIDDDDVVVVCCKSWWTAAKLSWTLNVALKFETFFPSEWLKVQRLDYFRRSGLLRLLVA